MADLKEKILMIEDEASIRQVMVQVLKDAGYQVLEASNGKEGLELALKEHPDLVLTDNRMPIMDGIDMSAEIRKDESWGKNVPIVIMTSMNDIGVMNKSLQVGVTDYIMKGDVGVDKIVSIVETRLHPSS